MKSSHGFQRSLPQVLMPVCWGWLRNILDPKKHPAVAQHDATVMGVVDEALGGFIGWVVQVHQRGFADISGGQTYKKWVSMWVTFAEPWGQQFVWVPSSDIGVVCA